MCQLAGREDGVRLWHRRHRRLLSRRDLAARIRRLLMGVMEQVLVVVPDLLLKEIVEVVHVR